MFRREIDWVLMAKVGIPSVIFVIIGAALNDKADLRYAELAMGLFLVFFAITFLINKDLKFQPSNFNAIVGGSIAGFLAGLLGTGGAVRGATLAAFDLPKGTFVGTSAGIDLAVDFSRTAVYLWNGYLESRFYWYIPVLMILAYAGAFVGKKILNLVPQLLFKRIVLFLILSVGLLMIYSFFVDKQIIR